LTALGLQTSEHAGQTLEEATWQTIKSRVRAVDVKIRSVSKVKAGCRERVGKAVRVAKAVAVSRSVRVAAAKVGGGKVKAIGRSEATPPRPRTLAR
jgi:hypothetical protein